MTTYIRHLLFQTLNLHRGYGTSVFPTNLINAAGLSQSPKNHDVTKNLKLSGFVFWIQRRSLRCAVKARSKFQWHIGSQETTGSPQAGQQKPMGYRFEKPNVYPRHKIPNARARKHLVRNILLGGVKLMWRAGEHRILLLLIRTLNGTGLPTACIVCDRFCFCDGQER